MTVMILIKKNLIYYIQNKAGTETRNWPYNKIKSQSHLRWIMVIIRAKIDLN